MLIGGLEKSSFVDFPGKMSAVVFTIGCNFRCGYCHNPELLKLSAAAKISEKKIISFLEKRKGKLDGVVITGGEPTLQNDLKPFIERVKKMGYLIKLDTNGSRPDVVLDLFQNNLLDYIAMDIKAPLYKYEAVVSRKADILNIQKSINLIMSSGINYEFRTTVAREELSADDLIQIAGIIKGARLYALQKFVPSKVYDKNFRGKTSYSEKELDLFKEKLELQLREVVIR